jgi:RNA polymerase sigma-70 factor (ECF subfamily)
MTAFSADELFSHGDALRRLARDLVADDTLADDAVQQAYVVALTRPPRERTSLAGWLRAVVRSCSLDLLRQQARRHRREQHVAAPSPLAPDEAAAQLELQAAIVAAVRGLGEPYASVVWLRWFEALTPSEIAARQGEPVKTIKTRLGRAMQMLRSKLDGRPGGRQAWLAALTPLLHAPLPRTAAAGIGGGSTLLLTHWLGGLLAAGLLIAAGVLAWNGSATPQDAATPTGGAVAAASAAVPNAIAGNQSRSDLAANDPSEQAARRTAAASIAPSEPTVKVRVLGTDGEPVPRAVVLYGVPTAVAQAAASSDLTEEQKARLRRDWGATCSLFGERANTDLHGIARWPWLAPQGNDRHWLCIVQHEGDYAETWLQRSSSPEVVHDLQLQRDRNFVCRVLDSRQQPVAGVPVAATFMDRNDEQHQSVHPFGATDEDGMVAVQHVQTWSERIAPRGATLPILVAIDLPGVAVATPIDANALPDQPVVLSLPLCGSLRISVSDATGAPVVGQPWVLREHEGASDRAFGATTDAAGVATFPRVAIGRSWRIACDRIPPEPPRIVIGPSAPGEQVDVAHQGPPTAVLRGRLQQDAVPLANTSFTMTANAGGRELPLLEGRTDGEGRFVVIASERWRNQRIQDLRVHPFDGPDGYTERCATWRGDRELTAGTHDLGDLALTTEPIVVGGTLLPPTGEPLPADVRLEVEVAGDKAPESWHYVSLRRRLQPDGRFTLFGSAPNGALRLVVTTANRFVPVRPLRFRAGDQDLRIELRRGGSLRASIVAETPIAAFCQVPLLIPRNEDSSRPHAHPFDPQLDPRMARESFVVGESPRETEFVWPAVEPGHYRLEIWARGLHRPLHTVADILIADGQRNQDPRLQRLAVPGLRSIDITLPQAKGLVPAASTNGLHGLGVVTVMDGDRPATLCWQIDGPMVMFATVQPLDVLVRLQGHRDRIVRGIVADQTIELEPGIPVTLRPEGYTVPAGQTLQFELTAVDDVLARARPGMWSGAAGGSIPGYQSMTIASDCADGTAILRLPTAGRHRVTASVRDGSGAVRSLATEPAELSIEAAGGNWSVRLRELP